MKKLRIILQSNLIYLFLLILTIIYCFVFINFGLFKSKFSINSKYCNGKIINVKETSYATILDVKTSFKERVLVYDYDKSKYNIGDRVKVYGKFKKIPKNTNFYLFNYRNFMKSNNTYFQIDSYKILKVYNRDFMYYVKNLILKKIEKLNSPYLYAFILGDTGKIDKEVKNSFQTNGISHLFALSGTHITLFISILNILLKKIRFKSAIIVSILTIYLFITNFSKSLTRAVFLYFAIKINKNLKLNISTFKLIITILCISLLYNPYNIYNSSFLYTYVVTISLIINKDYIKKYNNYISKTVIISTICFFSTIPILINNSFELNFLCIFFNIIFVPFVSFILFPLSLLTFLIPQMSCIFNFCTGILECLSINLSKIDYFKFTFCHINSCVFISYYIIILSFFKTKNKYILILFIISLIIHNNYRYFDNNFYYTTLDIGQGDSLLISLPNNSSNILIDTSSNKSESIIIPTLKSNGIKKINYLILSHGDFDHMGEAINLVNNFKVEKVIFNCGPYNDLEKELIKVLDKKKIKYYSCIKELNIYKNKLYFLQTKEYDNENDNSNVIYTELDGYKFMFMGDASSTTEKEILNKYNLPNVDVLKVGHHGSKTSSSEEFIDRINPKYSVISVGKNNRYGHPNKEALANLKDSKIYRTDEDGSIMFKIKNNKLNIETCSP